MRGINKIILLAGLFIVLGCDRWSKSYYCPTSGSYIRVEYITANPFKNDDHIFHYYIHDVRGGYVQYSNYFSSKGIISNHKMSTKCSYFQSTQSRKINVFIPKKKCG